MASQNPTLRELFEAALELPGEARVQFLESRCADPAQRARLERMLDAGPEPGGALPAAPAATLAGVLPDASVTEALPPGSRIGPFELIEVLGEGGSSTVFRAARTADGVRQEVALKLLRRGLYSPDAQRQFRRERQVLSQLRHPGIARLIEGGITETGAAYIALDLVDGVPITDHVREQRLDLGQRLALFISVCRAVEAAHRALIVHRDLKPSNVLVTGDGEVKLLDFGIAKLLDADDDTQTRLPAFTPAYASPEQRSGGLITTATDVYALGVLLGELITGIRLNEGSTRTPSSQISEQPEPGVLPASATVTRRQLRGDLDNIVLKALDADPARRYASAGAFADDIERLLDGRPVAAHPPSRLYRARKFVARHRGGVATTALFLLAIFAALGIALWQARVAQQQARVAREQAERADTTRRFLMGVFDHAEPDANLGKAISAHELVAQGERELASNEDIPSSARLELTVMIAHLYWDLDDYAHAGPLIQRAIAAVARADAADDTRARTLASIASMEVAKRKFDDALNHARQALTIAQRIGPAGIDSASEARRIVAGSLRGKDNSLQAEKVLREALARDRESYGDHHQAVIDDSIALGSVLTELSRFDEAITVLRGAADLARGVHGTIHSSVADALQRLGEVLGYAGDYAGSEKAISEAARIDEKIYGPAHNETLIARGNLYWSMERQGRYAEALQGRMSMLPMLEKLSATRPETVAAAYTSIGQDYAKFGRFDEAEAALRKALDLWATLQGSNGEWDSADPMVGLAEALRWHGRYTEAESVLRKAIAIEQKHEPPESGWLNRDRGTLGDFMRQTGRYDEALRELTDAVHARSGAKPDPLLSVLLAQLSQAQLDADDPAQALATATRSVAMGRNLFKSRQVGLGTPLFALARAELALGQADRAEPLLREAIAVRSPPNPANDPRVLEIKVSLVNALDALGRSDEARALRNEIEPSLSASASPYAAILVHRLASTRTRPTSGSADR
ncbi:MAG: tetratricopeptide repeat protein [Rhodanobacteraceae bacterium]